MGALPATRASNCCQRADVAFALAFQQPQALRAQEEARMLGKHRHRLVGGLGVRSVTAKSAECQQRAR